MKNIPSLAILSLMLCNMPSVASIAVTTSNFKTALAAAKAGDTLELAAGTYTIAYTAGAKNTITLSQVGTAAKPIVVRSTGFAKAVFDFSFPEQTYVQDSYGFLLSGSYWEFHGIGFTRAGYQGVYVTGSYNSFYDCSFFYNRNSGLEINKGGNHTLVVRTDSYRNFDPKKFGSMADGFASKQTQGAGNKFIKCRSWENSDDGFDFFDSPESVIVEDSWAFRNGMNLFGTDSFTGNGNGFKVGGNYQLANSRLLRCVAFGNVSKGFDQNHNIGGVTIQQSISYANGINFGFGDTLKSGQKNLFQNNISYAGTNADGFNSTFTTATKNSWNLGTVKSSDFLSLDTSLGRIARDNTTGEIPETNLFRLSTGSQWIDKGTILSFTYNGTAPDLGPYETGAAPTRVRIQTHTNVPKNISSYNLLGQMVPTPLWQQP